MNKKLNMEFIDRYKSVYAEQLIKQSFDSDKISGKEIIKVSPTKQLNTFTTVYPCLSSTY